MLRFGVMMAILVCVKTHFLRIFTTYFRYPLVMRVQQDDFGATPLVWTGTAHEMAVAHRHADLEINYVLEGQARYLIQGQVHLLPPRTLCLLWGATPHQLLEPERTLLRLFWVTLPMAQLWQMQIQRRLLEALLTHGLVIDPAPSEADHGLLSQWHRDSATTDGQGGMAPSIMTRELAARLGRLQHHLTGAAVRPGNTSVTLKGATAHVQTMARYMHEHLADNLRVTDIASAAGLRPNHAMTLFRRQTGQSLIGYLTAQRVLAAQRLLAFSDRPVLQIAHRCGFGSVSRFYEAFRQLTGTSPATCRRLTRTSP